MDIVHFYFDESGEKGFVRSDHSATDFGLVAGIVLPKEKVADFERVLDTILSQAIVSPTEKLHATDIFKDGANDSVKADLIAFLQSRTEWTLLYEAIYPLGIYQWNERTEGHLCTNATPNPQIRVSQQKSKLRIYAELIEGLIVKLDELCRLREWGSAVMISDRIDKGLFHEIETRLEYLRLAEHATPVSGFDTSAQKVVKGSVTSKLVGFDNTVSFVTSIDTEVSVSTMTVAADFVTNLLFRHLRSVLESQPNTRLHAEAAVSSFPLREQMVFIGDDYIMDSLYSPAPEP